MTQLRTAALSDIGRIRSHNEDRLLCQDALGLYGVADGVGGLPGGAEAAQQTVESIIGEIERLPRGTLPDLTAIVHRANLSVMRLGQAISPMTGIGCTLTFGWFGQDKLHLAHVGDSRCYVLRDGQIEMLTRDHSVESDALLRRARGETVYFHEAHRHALTRCIGQPTPPEVDLLVRPLTVGERYLLCTDGVSRMLGERELEEYLSLEKPPAEIARALVDEANERGGPDNSTVVVVMVEAGE